MKTISVREFQLHASKYLKELPLTLTQYGKPVAVVEKIPFMTTRIEYYSEEERLKLAKDTLKQAEEHTQHLAYPKPVKDNIFRFCVVCRQMKEGVESIEYLQDMEKTSDNICPDCANKIPMDLRINKTPLNFSGGVNYQVSESKEFKPYPKPQKKSKGNKNAR